MVSGEKRNCEGENALERITTILLDIEGTTTPISFVKDTLFPYVRENLQTYVDSHWDEEEFKADVKALKEQAKKDEEDKVDGFCAIEDGEKEKETLVKNVLWQMDLDRKTTALKQLQGHIWREGYESGKLKGNVFGDVPQMLKKWSEEGKKLYIYSSGSVEAQKLLFKNVESGDLSGFLSGYFDTEIGPKTEASSYSNIAKSVGCDCCQILFLTDVIKEAVAADKADLQVMVVMREGNNPLTDDEKKAFSTISSFKDIVFETSAKKKKICEDESIIQEGAKTENVEKVEETPEEKNGEVEKMEVETTESKPEDCNEETKNENNGETKTETEPTTKSPDTDSDNIEVDVDDSNVEKVSSSNVEETKEDSNTNGVTETPAEEEKAKVEEEVSTEEKVDSTNESNTPETTEAKEKDEGEKGEKEENVESESKEENVNGHENGEGKVEEGGENGVDENKSETNGKEEEEKEVESVPVKKVATEEQADSTVEVTA